jgi:hypothetical protein
MRYVEVVFCNVTQCGFCKNRRLVFLRIVHRFLVTANVVPSSAIHVPLMVEALNSSEMSVLTRAIRRNIPQDGILHSHLRENLKSWTRYVYVTRPTGVLNPVITFVQHAVKIPATLIPILPTPVTTQPVGHSPPVQLFCIDLISFYWTLNIPVPWVKVDLRFSRRWLWKMVSSGMLRREQSQTA